MWQLELERWKMEKEKAKLRMVMMYPLPYEWYLLVEKYCVVRF